MNVEIETKIKVLEIGPRDVVVVKCAGLLAQADADRIKKLVQSALGQEQRVLVIGKEIEIGILKNYEAL